MGWDFCEAWQSREDVRDEILRSYRESDYAVVASAFAREGRQGLVWLAVELDGVRSVVVALYEKSRGAYGFKVIDEGMGPVFYSVPDRVWDVVKDHRAPSGQWSQNWRAKVRARKGEVAS